MTDETKPQIRVIEIPQDPLAAAQLRVNRLYDAMALARQWEAEHRPSVPALEIYRGMGTAAIKAEQPRPIAN